MVYPINENTIGEFRRHFSIPKWVVIEFWEKSKDYYNIEGGHWLFSQFIIEVGITFPPNQLFLKFCNYFCIVLTLCTPQHLENSQWIE